MQIQLHPDAASSFNTQANDLLYKLAPEPDGKEPSQGGVFRPDIPISAQFTQEMITDMERSWIQPDGTLIARFFKYRDRFIGLHDESYKKFRILCEKIQRCKPLHPIISVQTTEDLVFGWMRKRYDGSTAVEMTDYLLEESQQRVQELTFWIPIAFTYLETSLKIGKVEFKTITPRLFDPLRAAIRASQSQNMDQAIAGIDEQQKRLQGLVAATITLYAEPHRAWEIAREETERSLAVLRFFAPANLLPGVTSYCTPLGKENLEQDYYLIFQSEDSLSVTQSVSDKSFKDWILDSKQLARFRSVGLDTLSQLLANDQRSNFQEDLLNAVLLYSRSALATNPAEKLMAIFAALDSFLLKDESEIVQQTVADRIAFCVGSRSDERRSIVRTVKAAYGLRSRFIHHGQTVEDLDTTQEFLLIVWRFFLCLVLNNEKYANRTEWIDKMDEQKYR